MYNEKKLHNLEDNNYVIILLIISTIITLTLLLINVIYEDKIVLDSSPNKSHNAPIKKRKRRFRSLSVSMDMEYTDHIQQSPLYNKDASFAWVCSRKRSQLHVERLRTFSYTFLEKHRSFLLDADLLLQLSKGLAILQNNPEIFPFEALPDDCKLHIFSYVSILDKGRSSKVCRKWNSLIKTSSLWSHIDFTLFRLCSRCEQFNQDCSQFCYLAYRNRMKKFFTFLISIRISLRLLKFAFDIGDHHDGWLELVKNLIRYSRCQELTSVDINWKETVAKPVVMNTSSSITWSTRDYKDFIYNERIRQRMFVKFLDFLTAAAPNIMFLSLPFDWSERSLRAISRLASLKTLKLEQYFRLQSIQQNHINMLLNSLTNLKYFTIETKVPNGFGFQAYNFMSKSLVSLNISKCSGIYIEQFELPNLTSLSISKHALYGPFINIDAINLPCLLVTLAKGCPNLKKINNLYLLDDWKDSKGKNELDSLLFKICGCTQHKQKI